MNVREAIVSDPRVLDAGADVREAAELLTHPNVRSVLVVKNEGLVGCVTADSIVARIAEGSDLRGLTAGDVAEPDTAIVGPDEPVDEVLRMMGERDLERVAVVEDGRLLGVLPREPLVRRLAEDDVTGDDVPADVGEGSTAGGAGGPSGPGGPTVA